MFGIVASGLAVVPRLPARLALAIVLCLSILAPRQASATTERAQGFIDSGTVIVATPGSSADLDPASIVTAAANVMVNANIEETLITFRGSDINHFVPLLATSWHANANKSVWTFSLRHGVRFHTGRCCMTAQDVRYSIARTVLANLAGAYIFGRYLKKPMQQIRVLGPYTVQFDLGRPQYTFLKALASKNAGEILDSKAMKAHATKSDPWAHNWITDHDAGTGPYVLQRWQRSQQVILTRFPQYWSGWKGRHFSKAIVRTVLEATTRRELVEKGQADLTFGLTPQDTVALEKNPAVRVLAPYGTEVDYIVMTEAGPLKSAYARQALSYAFDYNAFLQSAYHGFAKRARGPLASTLFGFDPHTFLYQTDLNKAKALLKKAGIKPGTTLTYMFASGYAPNTTAGLILQAQLQQIGLNLKLQGLDQAAEAGIFFGTEPASKRPNLMAYGWWPDYNDPWDECIPMVASYSAGAAGANGGYYSNKTVDALLARMKYAPPGVEKRLAAQLQDITSRADPPSIWLDEPAQVTVVAHSLHGLVLNPLDLQIYRFYPMYRS